MTHLQRLRKQCEPVQEDTPVPPREHKIFVDRRDLEQLLKDYDAINLQLTILCDNIEDHRPNV